ncbi:unnamed protein product, partial [Nesidiocoris tenuis]
YQNRRNGDLSKQRRIPRQVSEFGLRSSMSKYAPTAPSFGGAGSWIPTCTSDQEPMAGWL